MYLNCKTYFSFRYGTYSAKELVNAADTYGITTLALTNINNTCDVWEFVKACNEKKIKPIAGAEIRNGDELLYILLAANNEGLQWINWFLSKHQQEKKEFPLHQHEGSFFFDTWDGFVIYPLGKKQLNNLSANEYIGVRPQEINKLFGVDLQFQSTKLIILQSVTFQDKARYEIHTLLRCIEKNILLTKLPENVSGSPYEHFVSPIKLLNKFKDYPFIVTNTYRLIDACNISMEFGRDKNKKFYSANKKDDVQLLRKLAYDGLQRRYGNNNTEATARVEKELQIIDKLGFNTYFLITWDIIRYAKSRGFYYVGRGSGANSIVAYCLQITDVDPIELDLYFERFLNPYRTSPPDFDIDFSWLDRDDVIDYIFKRYGKDHVALLGMYSTFQYNAIIREFGKVYGLPKDEIDTLGEKGYYYGEGRSENFKIKSEEDHIHKRILQYSKLINNFPNYLSIHPGGMLISEEPIYAYTATHILEKQFSATQIDMFCAEDIGLYKIDILSQRGLGHIKEAIRLVKENKQVQVTIDDIEKFKKDFKIKNQIKNVDTIGCFYIESPAMRQLLTKLRCDSYITLVAASSIIRPGVSASGMMKEYIFRYHNADKFQHIHPMMKELMQETFGVMVYQEDVIKVAHHFGGLDMGEADILRRAMSGKYRGTEEMKRISEKFFANCKERGYTDEITREVWRQISSFAGYSFSKAHSASFAVESFQDLFLKTYYPMEFMVGVINNFGGFYRPFVYFYELMKTGAQLHLPCVNQSDYYTSIHNTDVYTGFVHVSELKKSIALKIVEERKQHGSYLHLQDFIERTLITPEQLNIVIQIGALRFIGKSKKQLLWQANFFQKKIKTHVPASQSMFIEKPIEFTLPELADNPIDELYDELEILGFLLRNPFPIVDDDPGKYLPAKDFKNNIGKQVSALGYFVDRKVVPTAKGEMSFISMLDPSLDWIFTVLFPDVYAKNPFSGAGFYRITGKVVEEFGYFSIDIVSLKKVGYKERKYANL